MRILTYKRTHIGDPDKLGRFGIDDCMGRVRGFRYHAVIGVGGISSGPRSFGIDQKINWVGISPRRNFDVHGLRAEIVEFDHFILLEDTGPLLESLAPHIAKRIYAGGRYILDSYSDIEKAEAIAILEWAKSQHTSPITPTRKNGACSKYTCSINEG